MTASLQVASEAARQPAGKLVLVLADGLRYDTAVQMMGYVEALVAAGRAQRTRLVSELPSLSRPLYATLINGRVPVDHGIVSNGNAGIACGESLFSDLAAAGKTSAVVAYHWFHELLCGTVFNAADHRFAALPALGIARAAWYFEDDYPDSHTFADAEALRRACEPDFLMIHPMGPDDAGHRHGGESAEYAFAARRIDAILARLVPGWLAAGYDVAITSDHGMAADRMHGGTNAAEREVPFVFIPSERGGPGEVLLTLLPSSQTEVRGFLAGLLVGRAAGAATVDTGSETGRSLSAPRPA